MQLGMQLELNNTGSKSDWGHGSALMQAYWLTAILKSSEDGTLLLEFAYEDLVRVAWI